MELKRILIHKDDFYRMGDDPEAYPEHAELLESKVFYSHIKDGIELLGDVGDSVDFTVGDKNYRVESNREAKKINLAEPDVVLGKDK